MKDFYKSIDNLIDNKEEFVIATILQKAGSAPREEGAKMLIKKDSSILGTIGGGLVEALVIKSATRVFENGKMLIEEYNLSNKDAAQLGMVCGGNLRVLLEYVDPNDENTKKLYKKIIKLQNANKDFIIITEIPTDKRDDSILEKWIYTKKELKDIQEQNLDTIVDEIKIDCNNIPIYQIEKNDKNYMIESFINYEKLYIIGAGHVAQKIAHIMKILGFNIVVLDDREEFANREKFATADEIILIDSFDNLSDYITVNSQDYVIIVTRGHLHDGVALAQMLKTDAKYIGMIGSIKKRDYTYERLYEKGFSREDIKRVYCPIGLNIYADSPEEIAISVAAEIIKVKREPKGEK